VSVAEIAAQMGLSEKRMRAVIRGLARCMTHPPERFVTIQVGRLNHAVLTAFNAMSLTNLKAARQVGKIVRELDRFGRAFAAEWRRPEASEGDAPNEGDAAFAREWLGGGEPALPDFDAGSAEPADDAGPENPAQPLYVRSRWFAVVRGRAV
jgi:hypothetical protein